MFNDDVQMGFFDIYDQYLLNILYDPRIRAGMTKAEVDSLLPDILTTARAWVANTNAPRAAEVGTGTRKAIAQREPPHRTARGSSARRAILKF
jgi:hypothetical protein